MNPSLPELTLVLIWKKAEDNHSPVCSLRYSKGHEIVGQVNVVRCLSRIIELKQPQLLKYESLGAAFANQVDSLLRKLEQIEPINRQRLAALCKKEKEHKRSKFFFGDEMSVIDIFLES